MSSLNYITFCTSQKSKFSRYKVSSLGDLFTSIDFGLLNELCWRRFLFSNWNVPTKGIRSAAKGRVDRCPARAAAAVSAADPTFRPEYSAHYQLKQD